MWISNRGHVIRDGGIILHPSGVFSNVLMQKNRHGIRKTSDLSKSNCSLHDICRQRYLVYYESYRDEIVQGRVGVRLHRLTRFETGTLRKTEVIADRYNLKQVVTFIVFAASDYIRLACFRMG